MSLEGAPTTVASGASSGGGYVSEQDSFAAQIAGGSLLIVIAIGYLGGLLMAFTPCVLPMVPILSGIIAGSGDKTTPARAFLLSLSYVGGIAAIYVLDGRARGLHRRRREPAGHLQPAGTSSCRSRCCSSCWRHRCSALFTIEMPSFIQTRLSDASNKQRAGTFIGVAVMGALSALIVSACVAPVLIGALTFVAKTGDALRGAIAMLSIALGMGTPLLLVGASAGALLPRAGAWMETIKNLFGVMFLAVAAWLARTHRARLGRHVAVGGTGAGAGLGVVARACENRRRARPGARWSARSPVCMAWS